MSYKKVLELADKFAETKDGNHKVFAEHFRGQFRALLNEMEGDYMTLRIKGFDRAFLKEYGRLYQNLLDLLKRFNHAEPLDSMRLIVSYVNTKATKTLINHLEHAIRNFLLNNRVAFTPGHGFSRARVNSLSLLLKLANEARSFIAGARRKPADQEEEELPMGGSNDLTRA